MTVEEYRQRMINAFHNADCDNLIALVALPTKKEFEHLEWLLKNHYLNQKQQPCDDAISRQAVKEAICDYVCGKDIRCVANHECNIKKLISELPSVTPKEKEKTGKWIYDEKSRVYRCSCCNRFPWRVKLEKHDEIFTDLTRTNAYKFCPNCGAKMVEPQESEDKE